MVAHQIPRKASVAKDSRTVAMEVGIRQGVCNDSPAEATGPENGWRCSDLPIPGRRARESGWGVQAFRPGAMAR
jgi:hypothetical protein